MKEQVDHDPAQTIKTSLLGRVLHRIDPATQKREGVIPAYLQRVAGSHGLVIVGASYKEGYYMIQSINKLDNENVCTAPRKFKMAHLVFSKSPDEHFAEGAEPPWLIHRAYKWFYEAHVLTLAVGASIDTEFRKITRME